MTIASRAYAAFVLAFALLAFGLVLFVPAVLRDGDTFLHIAAGNWMLDHHALLRADPFSFTMRGKPWVSHEWLAELLMALAYRIGGWPGLLLPFATTLALAVILLGAAMRRWMAPLPAAVLLFAAMYTQVPTLLARPHLLVLPILIAWCDAMLRARGQKRAPHPALALLMVLWVNLHGSFFVGLAFAGAMAGEAWLSEAGRRAQVARAWGVFLLAALAGALATPHGIQGLLLPFHLLRMPALSAISEWQPTNFATFQPMTPLLLGLLYVGLVYAPRLPRLRVALLLALVYTALQHGRNQVLLGMVGLQVIAEPLGRYFHADAPGPAGAALRPSRPAWGAALAGALLLFAVRIALPVTIGDEITRPVSALAHVPPALAAQPVLNSYSFGSYLIFRGISPFIDSRAELYGNDFLQAYLDMAKPDHVKLEQVLASYHIAWTLSDTHSAIAEMLDLLPGWKRLYADDTAVIHVRAAP